MTIAEINQIRSDVQILLSRFLKAEAWYGSHPQGSTDADALLDQIVKDLTAKVAILSEHLHGYDVAWEFPEVTTS